jgi:predicted DNA-binding protein
MSKETTSIRISKENKERLKERGSMDMSYDDVLTEVLDKLEELETEDE